MIMYFDIMHETYMNDFRTKSGENKQTINDNPYFISVPFSL